MSSDAIVIARRLTDAGATIWVQADAAGGTRQFRLDPSDAADFLLDPRTWTAKQWGVMPTELDAWEENNHMPRCGARTKSGKRCGNRLASDCDPPQFVAVHGQPCRVHE